ncbi:CYTH domain-containing protein [Pedobacter montanisoli]|uniref:CYTH domain-containing protein n=1 Tax=Pedobacter montanisoli TaxID=2923277 RepID=A0ABS9ZVQ8_9SPHI|nr:CYTH domain-containing protein [Pedobacter montanisoli]MCJ0742382.1 CYTH domain-containing protein [Pedobacter montanisoli]
MAIEIEHKYLVNLDIWKNIIPDKSVEIRQAYLQTDPEKTIRIRTKDKSGFITIKGKTVGASRLEFEYEIPIADANELINAFCSNLIEKTRHIVTHDSNIWEVDEFKGLNEGLIVAEIELTSEDEKYSIPNWLDKNVTDDPRYTNSNLTIKPFKAW